MQTYNRESRVNDEKIGGLFILSVVCYNELLKQTTWIEEELSNPSYRK